MSNFAIMNYLNMWKCFMLYTSWLLIGTSLISFIKLKCYKNQDTIVFNKSYEVYSIQLGPRTRTDEKKISYIEKCNTLGKKKYIENGKFCTIKFESSLDFDLEKNISDTQTIE